MPHILRSTALVGTISSLILLGACSSTPTKAPDVKGSIRNSLDQAGLKDVSVDQDRDKAVVSLGGHVSSDSDKSTAEQIARSLAGTQVVANQIAVLPAGAESTAKTINADLDKAIDKNLDAVLIQNGLRDDVKADVTNGVVTLTGNVNSERIRESAQRIAAAVPNVQQVVNKLDVKDQRATSTR